MEDMKEGSLVNFEHNDSPTLEGSTKSRHSKLTNKNRRNHWRLQNLLQYISWKYRQEIFDHPGYHVFAILWTKLKILCWRYGASFLYESSVNIKGVISFIISQPSPRKCCHVFHVFKATKIFQVDWKGITKCSKTFNPPGSDMGGPP